MKRKKRRQRQISKSKCHLADHQVDVNDSYGKQVILSQDVKYIGKDGWVPDPWILAKYIILGMGLK